MTDLAAFYTLALIVAAALFGTWFGAAFAHADIDRADADTPRHLCTFGCGAATWACGEPCADCEAAKGRIWRNIQAEIDAKGNRP